MSIFDSDKTDFDLWIAEEFVETGEFTALVVLIRIDEASVHPLCSTYLNVIASRP